MTKTSPKRSVKRKLAEVEASFGPHPQNQTFSEKFMSFLQNPTVKTVLGTILSTTVGAIVARVGQKYPNLSKTMKDGYASWQQDHAA